MNQKETTVQIIAALYPKALSVVAFYSNPKCPYNGSHSIPCPFDFLYALKPKNPV